jgi:hypothetical protein
MNLVELFIEAVQLTRPCTTPRPEPDLGDVTYGEYGDVVKGNQEQSYHI